MFVMTSYIEIGKYHKIKPSSVKWRCGVTSFVDVCTIILPRVTYLNTALSSTDINDSSINRSYRNSSFVVQEGDKVLVSLGYDKKNTVRFMGFVKNVNVSDRLELECEGYSYQLPKAFSKSYQNTTVKQILNDLTEGTDIQLNDAIPDVKVQNVRFKNASGHQVLQWMIKELCLAVYFGLNELYVGTLYGKIAPKPYSSAILKLGWNTVSDKDFKKKKTSENVQVVLVDKAATGAVKKTKSDIKKYSNIKEIKIKSGLEEWLRKTIANDIQLRENYRGYEGSIECFLLPHIEKGCVVQVLDDRFPERRGVFFCEQVEGSFDKSGGRQKVRLSFFIDEGVTASDVLSTIHISPELQATIARGINFLKNGK